MSTEQEAWPPANPAPTHKLPDNYAGLKEAFTEWWNQGSDSPPTNGDIVKYDKEAGKLILKNFKKNMSVIIAISDIDKLTLVPPTIKQSQKWT